MDIKCLVLGSLGVNCYLLTDENEAVIIDPGDECDKICEAIKQSGCTLKKILLTHGHFDHTGAVAALAKKTGASVYIHSGDEKMLKDNDCNLSFLTGQKIDTFDKANLIDDMEEIPFASSVIKVYHTPGHSDGSVSYLYKDNLFCGDLLFYGSIGRYDFGDFDTEISSIKFLLDSLDDNTKVYPGHGQSTTIGTERIYNPYIVNYILD